MDEPGTLVEAIACFADEERAFEHAVRLRWPDGVVRCPRCGSVEQTFVKTRRIWMCMGCRRQFSVRVGTMFEDSPLALGKWMLALWMTAEYGHRLSSYELARVLGVTQRTAWLLQRRIAGRGGARGRVRAKAPDEAMLPPEEMDGLLRRAMKVVRGEVSGEELESLMGRMKGGGGA